MKKPTNWIYYPLTKPIKPKLLESKQRWIEIDQGTSGTDLASHLLILSSGGWLQDAYFEAEGECSCYDSEGSRVTVSARIVYKSPETPEEFNERMESYKACLLHYDKWLKKNEKQLKLQAEWESSREKEKKDTEKRVKELKKELKDKAAILDELTMLEERLKVLK